MRTVAETHTDTAHDGLAAPLRIADARDLVVCIEDEPARVVPHAWAREAMTALGGPAFARAVDAVSRAPGEILAVVATGGALDVRIIRLRPMQRGGAA